MQVTVLGLGYVGLVSAACLAELGHEVMGYDIDPVRVRSLSANVVPLFEPGLEALVASLQAHGQLAFTNDLSVALRQCDLVMLAVGTPSDHDGDAELGAVLRAAHAVAQVLQRPAMLVVKSTVPVGTGARLEALVNRQLDERGVPWRVPVASNPEFLQEGRAVRDFLEPDRIVVGVARQTDAELLHALYAPLVQRGFPLLVMDRRSSELAKYACNVMLAARVSLINELAGLAEATGADIEEVARVAGMDPRIGPQFLRAGAGYGGSCFPKDVKCLARIAQRAGVSARMLRAIDEVNESQRRRLFERIVQHYGGIEPLRDKRIAVWGLAFKPGTDDVRESPGLVLVRQLLAAGAEVLACDPLALGKARELFPDDSPIAWCESAHEALRDADALALATEWPVFLQVPPAQVAASLTDMVVFDGRNALDARTWSRHGLRVIQVGRPECAPLLRPVLSAST